MSDRRRFAALHRPHRVWAVGSVRGEAQKLRALHRLLEYRLEDGDRLVYLGNVIGHGREVRATIDEVLAFRGRFMARPNAHRCDIAVLRGSQEEMWNKVLQVQFAPEPASVLKWMLSRGLEGSLRAYGGSGQDGYRAAREGAMSLTKWTAELRKAVQLVPGHAQFMTSLKRAAYTDGGELLFVHAGLDPSRPISAQSDTFWWGSGRFMEMTDRYSGYNRIIRGWDPDRGGVTLTDFTATVDDGCHFGGSLMAGCFDLEGTLVDLVEA